MSLPVKPITVTAKGCSWRVVLVAQHSPRRAEAEACHLDPLQVAEAEAGVCSQQQPAQEETQGVRGGIVADTSFPAHDDRERDRDGLPGPSDAWKASTRGFCMIGARAGIWACLWSQESALSMGRGPQILAVLSSFWPALHEKRKSTSFARAPSRPPEYSGSPGKSRCGGNSAVYWE